MANRPSPAPARSRRLPTLIGVAGLVAAAAIVAALTLGGADAGAQPLRTVGVQDLQAALQDGAILIDVREPHEYQAGHVEGAELMPLARTVALADDLPRDEPVYVVCRSGNRSLQASRALVEAGFQDVRNVDGGMIAWEAAGLPVAR
jgi:rhodanese-related sulfurtransferase